LRQACQRHAPPQCAFVVGAVQAVLDREPPGKGCAPLDQRVEMMVGRYGYGDKMSSDIVLWTTVLSMATLPLSVLLAAKLYGAV